MQLGAGPREDWPHAACCCPYAEGQAASGHNRRYEASQQPSVCPLATPPCGVRDRPGRHDNPASRSVWADARPPEGPEEPGRHYHSRREVGSAATDADAATAGWLARATMMLLWAVSITYVCLAAAGSHPGALQAADRLLPFLTGLVGLVFGFYFSPWRRRR